MVRIAGLGTFPFRRRTGRAQRIGNAAARTPAEQSHSHGEARSGDYRQVKNGRDSDGKGVHATSCAGNDFPHLNQSTSNSNKRMDLIFVGPFGAPTADPQSRERHRFELRVSCWRNLHDWRNRQTLFADFCCLPEIDWVHSPLPRLRASLMGLPTRQRSIPLLRCETTRPRAVVCSQGGLRAFLFHFGDGSACWAGRCCGFGLAP